MLGTVMWHLLGSSQVDSWRPQPGAGRVPMGARRSGRGRRRTPGTGAARQHQPGAGLRGLLRQGSAARYAAVTAAATAEDALAVIQRHLLRCAARGPVALRSAAQAAGGTDRLRLRVWHYGLEGRPKRHPVESGDHLRQPAGAPSIQCLSQPQRFIDSTSPRSVYLAPAKPIDMSGKSLFTVKFNSWGAVEGAESYRAIVTLTGSDGTRRTLTSYPTPDRWTSLSVSLANWSSASSVTRIEHLKAVARPTLGRAAADNVTWRRACFERDVPQNPRSGLCDQVAIAPAARGASDAAGPA